MFLIKKIRAWLMSSACDHHRNCCGGLIMVAIYHIVGENGCQVTTVWRTSSKTGNEILVHLVFFFCGCDGMQQSLPAPFAVTVNSYIAYIGHSIPNNSIGSQPTADAAAKAAAEQAKIDARSKRFGNASPAIAASLAAAKSTQGCPVLVCCHIYETSLTFPTRCEDVTGESLTEEEKLKRKVNELFPP